MDTHSRHESLAAAAIAVGTLAATVRLVRSADQLDVLIELFDVIVSDSSVLIAEPNPMLRLTFGPQHVAEEAFLASEPVPAAIVSHIGAASSVVVVPLTADFDFTVDAILDLAETTAGLRDGTGLAGGTLPDGTVTALEVPRGLLLTPAAPTRLVASRRPVTHGGTSEVWTAHFERARGGRRLEFQAIANRSTLDLLAHSIPDAATRADLVINSTTIAPLTASRMWLTSSGAFTDLHGEWDQRIARYNHRITTGRDVHAEVQSLGYLLPFGHRAAITEVIERIVLGDSGGGDTAALRLARFLTIVDPTVSPPPALAPNGGRGLPLITIDATASETTEITLVPVEDQGGVPICGVFDITAAASGADVMVSYLATDRGGNSVALELPATFIDDATAYGTGDGDAPAKFLAVANGDARRGRRKVDLRGQAVAYADPFGATGLTSKTTYGLLFRWEGPGIGATTGDLEAAQTPAIFAAVERAVVVDDVIGAVTGDTGDRIGVTFHPRWLAHGNGADNFDLSFLVLDTPTTSTIGKDSAVGGVAQIDILAEVFNQSAGVGPNLELPTSPWDPAIGEASKIIGNISLDDVLETVLGGTGADIPSTEITVDGDTIVVTFTYCRTLKSLRDFGFIATDLRPSVCNPGAGTRCCVILTTTTSLVDGVDASFSTEMRVENFAFQFPPTAPVVVVDFASVVASIDSDGAMSVKPTICSWDFSGMIRPLMALVDGLGLDNIDLKLLPDKLDMDSAINLPDRSLGVVELKNFTLNLGFDIPLDANPGQLSIGIGSKSAPLDIDVMMFGATFWLYIDLGFSGSGLELPTQTISLGVSVYWELLDFDIIVVSISFTLRLSADFRLSGNEVVFTGAVSLEGSISVLGLIEVSASIVASLTYRSENETMVLKGTVHYCVDTFLGKLSSGTVPIGATTIELGDGSSAVAPSAARAVAAAARGSASFGDRYSPANWNDYCDAFA